MNKLLTIIMYHYVRDLKNSRYPDIKGLDINLFKEQIGYIKRYYNVISAYDLMDIIESNDALPPRALLLTFDDAYIDHFVNVYPILDRYNLSASFFPPAKCIIEHTVLDVNKIHFILASVSDKSSIIEDIYRFTNKNRSFYKLESNEYYWKKFGKPSRFDPAEVIFIKRMLQCELPKSLRTTIINKLFRKYVTRDEAMFSQELYMNIEQITHLQRNGMYIGSHGFNHYWLNSLSQNEQEKEVDLSLKFLKTIGSNTKRWIMCYPYGAYDASLLDLLRSRGCLVGLTTKIGIADLGQDDPLTLPRLDTNDLPKSSEVGPNEWTIKVMNIDNS